MPSSSSAHISRSQINTPVFIIPLLHQKSPVSSRLQLLPNVLKTGCLHLNTNRKVWYPPPTQNDIPVSQSIKIVDPILDPLLHTLLKKSSPATTLPHKPSPLRYGLHINTPHSSPILKNCFNCWTFHIDLK